MTNITLKVPTPHPLSQQHPRQRIILRSASLDTLEILVSVTARESLMATTSHALTAKTTSNVQRGRSLRKNALNLCHGMTRSRAAFGALRHVNQVLTMLAVLTRTYLLFWLSLKVITHEKTEFHNSKMGSQFFLIGPQWLFTS